MTQQSHIRDLTPTSVAYIQQIEVMLCEAFKEFSPAWVPNLATANQKIQESFAADRVSRVLVDADSQVLGWGGAIIGDNVWEIHPMVVKPTAQRCGYGRMLVDELIHQAKSMGAVAVWAGTGDETGATSFSKVDLYNDPASAIANFEAPTNHPIFFWLKIGFSIVGVLPDEEGLGKPGIHLAKRIVSTN